MESAAKAGWPVLEDGGQKYVEAPGGYRFYIKESDIQGGTGNLLNINSLYCPPSPNQ